MFCIAAFIVFAVLGIFSASYRPLVKQAWHCVVRRITFKPCDISFGDEVKGRLVGKLMVRHPRLARFVHRWIDWLSFLFVALSVWSLLYVFNAGLNLWIYDTCNPRNVESCSLSGEACGIDQASLSFTDAMEQGRVAEWAAGPFTRLADTLSRIPNRIKTWDAKAYYGPTATTYFPADPAKPYALEVMDPGCKFCKKLFENIKASGFEKTHNLSYLLYPIPLPDGTHKFPHSVLLASYIEAVKMVPLAQNPSGVSPDWQLIERVFGQKTDTVGWQEYFDMGATKDDVTKALRVFLRDIGYAPAQISRIEELAHSHEVAEALERQRALVEDGLRTIKIPTILFGGHRYDRVVDAEKLGAAR